jgi:heme a synthase
LKQLKPLSTLLIYYTLLVILWGAWVRISHSGDGCGDSWPLCAGELIPENTLAKTWIEYLHRATSGLFGIFVLLLFFGIRKFEDIKNTQAKKWSLSALLLTGTEALLGALLVKKGLVADNQSVSRAVVMGLHFMNSAALVAAVTQTRMSLHYKNLKSELNLKNIFSHWRWISVLVLIVLGVTGTWAALSTTLFPSSTLAASWAKEFEDNVHWLLKIRSFHPVAGLTVGILFAGFSGLAYLKLQTDFPEHELPLKKELLRLTVLLVVTIAVGLTTLFTLSPNPMKLMHLLLAYLIFIQTARVHFFWNSGLSAK